MDDLLADLGAISAELRRGFDRHTGTAQNTRRLLTTLRRHGELSHTVLQRQLGVDGAAVTRLVKPLETDGLVARRLDPADNRFTLSSLTDAGARRADELAAAHDAFAARLVDGTSAADATVVSEVVERIRRNLAAATGEPAGSAATGAAGKPAEPGAVAS